MLGNTISNFLSFIEKKLISLNLLMSDYTPYSLGSFTSSLKNKKKEFKPPSAGSAENSYLDNLTESSDLARYWTRHSRVLFINGDYSFIAVTLDKSDKVWLWSLMANIY